MSCIHDADVINCWHDSTSIPLFLIMYVNSLVHFYCWDIPVSFNNYSSLYFRGLILLRPFLYCEWMFWQKPSTLSTISHECSVASMIKSSKDLKWGFRHCVYNINSSPSKCVPHDMLSFNFFVIYFEEDCMFS